jgi:FkbM family methyltransferase
MVRRILFSGPVKWVLKSRFLQPAWVGLQKLALYGLNYGSNTLTESGELWTLGWLQKRHAARRPGTPAVVFDVGAHDGHYSLSVVNMFGDDTRVESFEPSAAVFKTFQANTSGFPNIQGHHCGLGEQEGSAKLYYDAVGSQCASVHTDAHSSGSHLEERRLLAEEIRIRTIDVICEEKGIARIDLLKIDVEGNELNVLRGAKRMIDAGAVEAIQFEFGEAQIGSRTYFKDIHQFLNPRYQIQRILAHGLSKPLDPYDEILEVYRTTNYLALRRDR